jgi:hypothetical protein
MAYRVAASLQRQELFSINRLTERGERGRRGGSGEEVVSWSDGAIVGGVRQCGRHRQRRQRIIP